MKHQCLMNMFYHQNCWIRLTRYNGYLATDITLYNTLYRERQKLIGCICDEIIMSWSEKHINEQCFCSLYLMTDVVFIFGWSGLCDQMKRSLMVCMTSPAAASHHWLCFGVFCLLSHQDGGFLPGASQLLCHGWGLRQIHRPGRARGAGLHQKPTEWVLLCWRVSKWCWYQVKHRNHTDTESHMQEYLLFVEMCKCDLWLWGATNSIKCLMFNFVMPTVAMYLITFFFYGVQFLFL